MGMVMREKYTAIQEPLLGLWKMLGKSNGFITQVTQAATVYREIFTQVKNSDFEGRYKHLYEIHAAPQWLWSALVKQMIESGWTVQVTRDKVGAFKEVADPGR